MKLYKKYEVFVSEQDVCYTRYPNGKWFRQYYDMLEDISQQFQKELEEAYQKGGKE
jgi:hypothetical protein